MTKVKSLFLITLSILIGIFVFEYYFKINTEFKHYQLNTLIKGKDFTKDIEFKNLLKDEILKFEFKSDYDNLGIVEILFNNHSRINKDKLEFSIKEVGNDSWYYNAVYDTSLMDSGEFFPFGFPKINDSKSKVYRVEIKSLSGLINDSVSLNNRADYFKTKYVYDKHYLINNLFFLPTFILLKIGEVLSYFELYQIALILVSFGLPYIASKVFSTKKSNFNIFFKKQIKLKVNYGLIAILFIFFVSHLRFINYSQYWDSEWYWQLLLSGVNNVRNNGSFLTSFNFLGHPSMGYVSLLSIGQFIDFGNIKLLNLTNIILATIAVISFYYLMKLLFINKDKLNLLFTLLFAFNPLIYATTISLNLDFAVLVFATLSFTFLFYKKYNLFLISTLFLIFSKETGLLVYGSILLACYIFFRTAFWKFKYHLIVPFFVFLLYLYLNNWNFWNSSALTNSGNKLSLVWENNKYFVFGFNYENIKLRLFQIFVMNFNWLMTPVILYSLFKIKNRYFKFISLIFSIFILFNLIYTVMPFSRYVVLSSLFILVQFAFSINYLAIKSFKKYMYVAIVTALMIIQTFKSIDPSPGIFFGTNKIGNNISSPVFGFRDGLVYNSEFVFVDRLSEYIKDRNEEGLGIILNTGSQYFFKGIGDIGTVEQIDKVSRDHKKLQYVYVPWFTDKDKSINDLSKSHKVSFKETIQYNGYFVEVYNLTK